MLQDILFYLREIIGYHRIKVYISFDNNTSNDGRFGFRLKINTSRNISRDVFAYRMIVERKTRDLILTS
jgi:hypothetical protein